MPTRNEFKEISKTKFREVKALYRNRLYDGARYCSGYVVEMALKARICRVLDLPYPESGEIARSFMTHKFDILVKLAGLQNALDHELNTNVNFKTNWSLVTSWTEAVRYNPVGTTSKSDIEDIISALEDKNDGVLTWIKKRW